MINTKSLLYKTKYYSISYKLSFITKCNFKIHRGKYKIDNVEFKGDQTKIIQDNNSVICYNPFVFDYLFVKSHNKQYYIYCNLFHRTDGPAIVEYDNNGDVKYEYYFQYGKKHNENGPAYIHRHDKIIRYEKWIINDKTHRLNKPAVLYYYDNGQLKFETYYEDGKCHRVNGPALIIYNKDGSVKSQNYFYHGVKK